MPDPRDDLVRRGDVLDMIDAESHGDEGLAIIDSRDILALPADPVAAAAVALAEAASRWHAHQVKKIPPGGLSAGHPHDRERARVGAEFVEALERYRAALAGRERGR